MSRRVFVALLVLGGSILTATTTHTQFLKFGPNGSIGIQNGTGSYTYFYPDRLNPWANLAVPGSTQQLPNGQIWQGWDGQVHGNVVDPSTGDMHAFKYERPGGGNQNNGFLAEPTGRTTKQPRMTSSIRQAPSQTRYLLGRRR